MDEQVAYDPQQNPRDLTVVPDPEAISEVERKLSYIDEQMQVVNKIIGTFSSKGWEAIRQMLVKEMVAAKQWCANPDRTASIEDLRFVQGQVKAYQYLMGLGEEALQLKNLLVNDRAQLKLELGEEG